MFEEIRRFPKISVLIVNVLPQGIIFGADRLSRWSDVIGGRIGFAESSKVLRWPNRRALLGFVGLADLGRHATRNSTWEWLSDFIGRHFAFPNLETLASDLCTEIQQQFDEDGWPGEPEDCLVVELAGFELSADANMLPQVWHIANTHGIDEVTLEYTNIDRTFGFSEECLSKFVEIPEAQIPAALERLATRFEPFWIHQTGDFGRFNRLSRKINELVRDLVIEVGDPPPVELEQWENQVRMKVLTYGSYFESFESPLDRAVGAGCDIVSIEWP